MTTREPEDPASKLPPVYLPPVHILLENSPENYLCLSGPTKTGSSNMSNNNISLNVHLEVPTPAAAVVTTADGSHTPNTPEILNSIVNMQSGPFASYTVPSTIPESSVAPGNQDTTSICSPISSSDLSTASPLTESPASTPSSTMSIQHYRSQFIKEGLKMKVKEKLGSSVKRKSEAPAASMKPHISSTPSPSSTLLPVAVSDIKREELTEEDELRRKRRRERNKIAATKCRNKKKMRTQILQQDCEKLEVQNHGLNTEIKKLETEKNRLMELLAKHEPNCAKRLRQQHHHHQNLLTAETVQNFDHEFRVPQAPTPLQNDQDDDDSYNQIPSLSNVQSHDEMLTAPFQDYGDVKPELQLNDLPLGAEVHHVTSSSSSAGSGVPGFIRASCSFENSDPSLNPGSFLAKRSTGHSFLDLDSRCVAL